jgi:Flp pilus assembly protein TadG
MFNVRAGRTAARDRAQSGQTLAEFALVIPMLMLLVMAILEFALAFNAFVGLNRASQNAAHLASVMGNQLGTDCLVLSKIDQDVQPPNDANDIRKVIIERTALAGNVSYQQQTYTKPGSWDCTLPDGTATTVAYTPAANDSGLPAYPEAERCPVLDGCPAFTQPRSTVDNIGVRVQYRHAWATPLSTIIDALPGGASGWTFTQRNIFRIEPLL